MRNLRKIPVLILALIILVSVLAMPVLAASSVCDGLELAGI